MNYKYFNRTISVELGPQGQNGFKIPTDFRIAFNIKKTSSKESNKATLQIYNLKDSTRNQIRELDYKVIINAGHVDARNEAIIFIGDVTRINHQDTPPTIVSTIEANDGEISLREKRSFRAYKEGTKIRQVLTDITKDLGLPLKIKLENLSFNNYTFNNGYSVATRTKDVLSELTDIAGLEWSIQNNELKITEPGKGDFTVAPLLTPSSGLIGSPERLEDIGTKSKKNQAIPGWKIKAILQPNLEPGGLIAIESKEIPAGSEFKIKDIEHRADNWSQTFESLITVREIR